MGDNLYAAFRDSFPVERSRAAFVRPDGSEWSYDRLDETAGRFAALLRRLGVEPGDRVAVQTEKSVDAVCLYLGCLQAGAVYLPLNTAYTPD